MAQTVLSGKQSFELLTQGLLFEINRSILHPYGYALALSDEEPYTFQLIHTDDLEGSKGYGGAEAQSS
jgi:hypothetical protein